jgi:hypothetical protein
MFPWQQHLANVPRCCVIYTLPIFCFFPCWQDEYRWPLLILFEQRGTPLQKCNTDPTAGKMSTLLKPATFYSRFDSWQGKVVFLCGEGSRSRRYGRTATLSLIVPPCDEDDDQLYIFPSNGAPVEWKWQGKTEVVGEKPVPVPLCPPQIPHGMSRYRNRASAVERLKWYFSSLAPRPTQQHT